MSHNHYKHKRQILMTFFYKRSVEFLSFQDYYVRICILCQIYSHFDDFGSNSTKYNVLLAPLWVAICIFFKIFALLPFMFPVLAS